MSTQTDYDAATKHWLAYLVDGSGVCTGECGHGETEQEAIANLNESMGDSNAA